MLFITLDGSDFISFHRRKLTIITLNAFNTIQIDKMECRIIISPISDHETRQMHTINNTNPLAIKKSLFNLSVQELRDWLQQQRQPTFHADQIMQWIYQKHVASFDQMSNLSKTLRAQLDDTFTIHTPPVIARQHDDADGTTKILMQLHDQEGIEAVRMPRFSSRAFTNPKTGKVKSAQENHPGDQTVCLSTQAGCLFACRFCASGQMGLKRNLSAGEIVAQPLVFARENLPFSRIVFMGTGEPLHNFDALRKAIEIFCEKQAFGFSPRRLTVSTVGLVPEIYRMAKEDWKVKLAVSLHATTDEKRAELIPLAKAYQLDQLMDALRFYQNRNKRRISFEYLMIDRMNDKPKDVERLARLCDGLLCHVNLIPYNPVPKSPFRPSSPSQIEQFKKGLLEKNFDATVRYSRGRHIEAACGQLRLRHSQSG
jgi:23S rRNA (adenine2503-C2)-methyltransferase